MKRSLVKHRVAAPDMPGFTRILPEIQSLIEVARQHVVSTANLTLVRLYWNVGRVITEDIQQNQKRAGYGEQLLRSLADVLIRQYGSGFSRSNLNDMRRFCEAFEILQAVPVQSGHDILPPAVAESCAGSIWQPPSIASTSANILQPVAVKFDGRLTIDFTTHAHLGWTHYRILLAVEAGLKRGFYFQQAASQRWSKRELQRQIDRALFERVALAP